MKRFTVNAVKWFDGVNGNTYHSCAITRHRDGAVIFAPYQYGYGDQYRQSALELMKNTGWIRTKRNLYAYDREHNYPIIWNVSQGLKRDCIRNGGE